MKLAPATTALAAGALLLTGLLSACGGGDDSDKDSSTTPGQASTAPRDAKTSEFCTVYGDIVKSGASDLKAAQSAVKKLTDVGTPDDMDADARAGYEVMIDTIEGAKSDDELTTLGQKLSKDQTAKLVAFSQYVSTTCADELNIPTGGATSPSASE